MGARFINDEEVASNEACMKLCCEEDECDVFIFEEKVNIDRARESDNCESLSRGRRRRARE
jgi:hypothetical protein